MEAARDNDGDVNMDRRSSRAESPDSAEVEAELEPEATIRPKPTLQPAAPIIEPESPGFPRRGDRQFTKEAIARENEEERARALRQKDMPQLKSRFIEGTMRDRHSDPPPREIVGDLQDFGDWTPIPTKQRRSWETESQVEEKKKTGLGAFGLSLPSILKINPIGLLEEVGKSYSRQKVLYEQQKRQKEEKERQKREAEELYAEMKRRGEFKGTFPQYKDLVEAAIGKDEELYREDFATAKKRKRSEVTSVASEKDAPEMGSSQETLETNGSGSGSNASNSSNPGSPIEAETEPATPTSQTEDADANADDAEVQSPTVEFADPQSPVDMQSPTDSISSPISPILPGPRPQTAPAREKEKTTLRTLIKKSSLGIVAALTPSSSHAELSLDSKQRKKKEEQLQKKVSTLQLQLEQATRELEEVRGATSHSNTPSSLGFGAFGALGGSIKSRLSRSSTYGTPYESTIASTMNTPRTSRDGKSMKSRQVSSEMPPPPLPTPKTEVKIKKEIMEIPPVPETDSQCGEKDVAMVEATPLKSSKSVKGVKGMLKGKITTSVVKPDKKKWKGDDKA
ncbi:hypothetical protein BZA77DRAFT_323521 [Pyronema omphalodes]|nr:hypothetical protein BZA77DRAFT_323521 [Pyronema omphalodes]